MKPISLFHFFLFFLFSFSLSAQVIQWDSIQVNWQATGGPPGIVNEFSGFENRIFAATNTGLYHSVDEGENWTLLPVKSGSPSTEVLRADGVYYDGKILLVRVYELLQTFVTSNDARYHTYVSDDHGSTFSLVLSDNGSTSFHGISAYGYSRMVQPNDSTFCFFMHYSGQYGLNGNALRWSTDYGKTWEKEELPLGLGFNYLAATNDTVALMKNDIIRFYRGSDFSKIMDVGFVNGGTTPSNSNIIGFEFIDQALLVAKKDGEIVISNDLGFSWPDTIKNNIGEGAGFYYKKPYYYFTSNAGLFRSEENYPANFSLIYDENSIASPSPACSVLGIVNDDLWLNVLDHLTIKSKNGIGPWELKSRGMGTSRINTKLVRSLGDELWAYSNRLGVFKTKTGGNWEYDFIPEINYSGSSYNAFYFRDFINVNGKILAKIKETKSILSSTDNGMNWQTKYTSSSADLNAFLYEETVNKVYLGTSEDILVSEDEGETWSSFVSCPFVVDFFQIKEDSIVVLSDQTIQVSANKGQSWNQPFNEAFSNLFKVQNYLVATTLAGRILISADFGNSWLQTSDILSIGSPCSDPAITAVDDLLFSYHCVIGKNEYRLFVSPDLGLNWTMISDMPFGGENQPSGWGVGTHSIGNYLIQHKEHLYAFSNGYNTWRTPLNELKEVLDFSSPEFGVVKGHVFQDDNGNCTFDSGEEIYSEKILKLTNGRHAMTNREGYYAFAVPPGDYQVQISPMLYHEFQCDSDLLSPDTLTTVAASEEKIINVSMIPIPDKYDLELTLNSFDRTRPGFSTTLKVNVKNVGTEIWTGSMVLFEFEDDFLNYVTSSIPAQQNGGNLQFDFLELLPGEELNIDIRFLVETSTPLDTSLTFAARTSLNFMDETPLNNQEEIIVVVTGAYDPNDKQVKVPGQTPTGDLFPGQHVFDYTIRFQNTGTDTAFQVIITDTLSKDLELLDLEVLAASHPYRCDLDGRIMRWIFDDILLPDSTTNFEASNGFIRFRIPSERELEIGEEVTNTAAIYFDFNDPIITNTVYNLIVKPVFKDTLSIALCANEEYEGQIFYSDTIYLDTVEFADLIQITQHEVELLATYFTMLDTTLVIGELFEGVAYTEDTTLVKELKATNGCDSLVNINIVVRPIGVGSSDLEETNSFSVLPNPASDFIEINWSAEKLDLSDLQILNQQGQVLEQLTLSRPILNSQSRLVDLRKWEPGIYFIRLKSNTEVFTQKLLVF